MLNKYVKALIAVLGAVATTLLTIGADPNVTGAVPAGWAGGVLAAGAAVTGLVTFLKRNQMTVDQVDKALEAGDLTLNDLRKYFANEPQAPKPDSGV